MECFCVGCGGESEVDRHDATVLGVASGPAAPQSGSVESLAQAGDVGFTTRGSHNALSGATRNIVINLGT